MLYSHPACSNLLATSKIYTHSTLVGLQCRGSMTRHHHVKVHQHHHVNLNATGLDACLSLLASSNISIQHLLSTLLLNCCDLAVHVGRCISTSHTAQDTCTFEHSRQIPIAPAET